MVKLGLLNSRMKDFFDVWVLTQQFEFSGDTVRIALTKTFENRGTPLTATPTAFTKEFLEQTRVKNQWAAFLSKGLVSQAPKDLRDVVAHLTDFIGPVASAGIAQQPFDMHWAPGGPWR